MNGIVLTIVGLLAGGVKTLEVRAYFERNMYYMYLVIRYCKPN